LTRAAPLCVINKRPKALVGFSTSSWTVCVTVVQEDNTVNLNLVSGFEPSRDSNLRPHWLKESVPLGHVQLLLC
jgi:hypothetical protein